MQGLRSDNTPADVTIYLVSVEFLNVQYINDMGVAWIEIKLLYDNPRQLLCVLCYYYQDNYSMVQDLAGILQYYNVVIAISTRSKCFSYSL